MEILELKSIKNEIQNIVDGLKTQCNAILHKEAVILKINYPI